MLCEFRAKDLAEVKKRSGCKQEAVKCTNKDGTVGTYSSHGSCSFEEKGGLFSKKKRQKESSEFAPEASSPFKQMHK